LILVTVGLAMCAVTCEVAEFQNTLDWTPLIKIYLSRHEGLSYREKTRNSFILDKTRKTHWGVLHSCKRVAQDAALRSPENKRPE
jgi:hypothetical protein